MRTLKLYLSASVFSLIDQFGQALGVLVSGILLVRFLGAGGFGLITLATVATALAIIVNTAVILDPAAQIAQCYAKQAPSYARTVFVLAGVLALPLAAVSAIVFAAMAPLESRSLAMLWLVAFLAVSQTTFFTIRRLSIAIHRGAVAACLSMLGAVVVVVGALLLQRWELLSVESWIGFQSAAYAMLSGIGVLLTCHGGAPISTGAVVREHRLKAPPLLALNGANYVAFQSPVILLDHYAGVAATGVFRSLLNLVQPFTLLMIALVNAFVPIVAKAKAPGIAPDIAGAICVFTVCVVGSVGLVLEPRLLRLLFGPDFHPPRYALALLLGGVFFQALQSGSAIRFRASGNLRPLAMSQVIAATAAPMTAALLTPSLDVVGAVLANVVALATSCLWILIARIRERGGGK